MSRTRFLLLSMAIFSAFSVAVWAVDVRIPDRVRKATLVVNDLGDVVFGSTPANVAVTNLPSVSQVEVTNFPPTAVGETLVSFYVPLTSVMLPTTVITVPSDSNFVLTDIDGLHSCGGLCALSDSSGIRLAWPSCSFSGDQLHLCRNRSYTTGVMFSPGETITLQHENGAVLFAGGSITFMGRFVPASS